MPLIDEIQKPDPLRKVFVKLPAGVLDELNEYVEFVSDAQGFEVSRDEVMREILRFAFRRDREFREWKAKKTKEAVVRSDSTETNNGPFTSY